MMLYFLKLSVSLAVLWVFYQLVLRRLTFYNLNRWYLLGYSVLCFFIPLIDVGPALGSGDEIGVIRMIPVVAVAASVSRPGWGIREVAAIALAAGVLVLLVRLLVRWLSLVRLSRRSRLLAEDGRIRIYRVEGAVRPFSFGRAVYLNPELHTESELADIVLHEYVHIRQKHSVDILFAELLSVIGWYNPFVWLIRHSIRQNLEFIADRQVLGSGVDRKAYQYHLLNVVGRPAYRIANSFNFSSLKKRIVMMNKSKSARLHLVKFLFVLPLVAVLLLAFRSTYERIGRVRRPVAAVRAEVLTADGAGSPAVPERLVRHWVMPAGHGVMAAAAAGHGVIAAAAPADTSKPAKDTALVPSRALYLVDGKETSPGELNPATIYSMNVVKGDQALALFGEKGKYGVIAVITKDFHRQHTTPEDTLSGPLKPVFLQLKGKDTLRLGKKDGVQPLYIVDGKEMPDVSNLDPNTIESLSVIRDAAAKAVYGDKGKNGVIIIVLKKKSSYVPRMTIDGKEGPMSIMADTIRTKLGGDQVVITAEKVPGQ